MARQAERIVGRRHEIASLASPALGATLRVLRGAPGIGRSALLAQLRATLQEQGATVLHVRPDAPRWDHHGVRPVLSTVREHYEQLAPGVALSRRIAALTRLCTPRAYTTSAGQAELLDELGALCRVLAAAGRTALLVDDVDVLADPTPLLVRARRAGLLVVAALSRSDADPEALCAQADGTVELAPLSDAAVATLVRRVGGARLDEAVPARLKAALGPLYGNPQALLATVAELREQDRLVVRHQRLCLRDPGRPITLPASHPVLREIGGPGTPSSDLVILAAGEVPVGVDDLEVLAAARGRAEEEVGAEGDRLIRAGVLDTGHGGELRVCCPALGAAVAATTGAAAVRELHRDMAQSLLRGSRPTALDEETLTDHVAAAGPALPPSSPLAPRLRAQARVAVLCPDVAARRYRAAWWHADSAAERAELADQVRRVLVRGGRYEALASLVEDLAAAPPAHRGDPDDLVVAAALAALHCARPLAPATRAVLEAAANDPGPLEFCDRWFAGEPLGPEELVSAFSATSPEEPAGPPPHRGAPTRPAPSGREPALGCRSLTAAFEGVLGRRYGAPATGQQAVLGRVVEEYAAGRWSRALSAAREILLAPGADPVTGEFAALLAVEMSAGRADRRRGAAAWSDAAPDSGALAGMRGWVELGRAWQDGRDPEGALADGWRMWERCRAASRPDGGAWPLLLRLTLTSVVHEQREWRWRLLREARELRERDGTRQARETYPVILGLCRGDVTPVVQGVALTRERGDLPALTVAATAAGLVADDPQPWLREAHELAEEIGSSVARSIVRRAMEQRGLLPPSVSTRPVTFSAIEHRIVDLVRDGRTNRQIAAETHVSEKTVEYHLTRLFLKVGCRTRHGLAAASLGGRLTAVGA